MASTKITNQENMAKATGKSLPISPKQSVEICNFIRNKNLQRAKNILDDVIAEKIPVPYKRYNRSIGHKTGKLSVGRYPIKACKQILAILNSAESNAQTKGLNTSNLVITSLIANKGSKQYRYGRQRGRRMKRTHIEVVLEEKETKVEPKKEEKKVEEKEKPKVEEKKPEVKKEVPKQEQPKAEEKQKTPKVEQPKESKSEEIKK